MTCCRDSSLRPEASQADFACRENGNLDACRNDTSCTGTYNGHISRNLLFLDMNVQHIHVVDMFNGRPDLSVAIDATRLGVHKDVCAFCESNSTDEITEHGNVLIAGRYVGAEEVEDDGVPFEEKMTKLAAKLYEQFAQDRQLGAMIRKNSEALGYGK